MNNNDTSSNPNNLNNENVTPVPPITPGNSEPVANPAPIVEIPTMQENTAPVMPENPVIPTVETPTPVEPVPTFVNPVQPVATPVAPSVEPIPGSPSLEQPVASVMPNNDISAQVPNSIPTQVDNATLQPVPEIPTKQVDTPLDNNNNTTPYTAQPINNEIIDNTPKSNFFGTPLTTPEGDPVPEPISFDPPINQPMSDTNQTLTPKKKKKSNPIFIIILLLALIGGGVYVYLTYFADTSTATTTPTNNSNTILTEIKTIIDNTDEIDELAGTYTITNTINENVLMVKYDLLATETTESYSNTCNFTLTDNILSTKINLENESDALSCSLMSLVVFDAVGQIKGFDEGEISNIINSTPNSLEAFNLNSETGEMTLDLNGNFEVKEIPGLTIEDLGNKETYFSETEEGFVEINKDNLDIIIQYAPSYIQAYVIEDGVASDVSYNALLTIVEFLFPESLDTFTTNIPVISETFYENFYLYDTMNDSSILTTRYGIDVTDKAITTLYIIKNEGTL